MNDLEVLRRRLRRAIERRDGAAAYSPDWDAAMAAVDELKGRLAKLRAEPVHA